MQKMLIAFAIVAAVLVLSVLGYIGYKAYKLHKRYQAATTMDISQYMTGETERTIEQTITSLKHQNLIDNSNEALYRKVLTDNLAWFAKNGTGSADEFRNRILATADSLKHLLVHEQVIRNLSFFFRVANIEYGRTHTLSFAEDVINSWVAKNLSFSDKLNMVIAHVTEYTNVSNDDREAADLSRKEIYTRVREKLLADINKVQADSAMSSNAYLSLVQQGLKELDQMELKPDGGNNYSMVVLIPKTYYDMGKLIEADMSKPLTDWYNKQTAYTPPTFDELEKNIRSYIGYMREAEFVNERDRQKIETIVTSDIRLFKSLSDSATLARTAIESLKKLEQLAGDTEDRETFASFYCELAHNKGFSIGEQVNEWMYGLPDKELEEEAARRMPWER